MIGSLYHNNANLELDSAANGQKLTGGLVKFAGLEQNLGFWGAVSSLALSMIGTGVCAFPYGFAKCGYIAGPLSLLVIATLASLSFMAIATCTQKAEVGSWADLVHKSLSPAWSIYANCSLFVMLVLAVSAYILIAFNIFHTVAHVNGIESIFLQKEVCCALLLAFMMPLVLGRSLTGLAKLSVFCTFCLSVVVAGILFESSKKLANDPPVLDNVPTAAISNPLPAVPIFACAAFGHMNMPQTYAELQPKLKPKVRQIVLTAVGVSMMLYTAIGLIGYSAYGKAVKDDVVMDIGMYEDKTEAVVATIQVLLAFFIILKTPMLILPTRGVVMTLLGKNASEASTSLHVAVTFGILCSSYLGVMACPSLSDSLSIMGAIVVMPLCFIFPARLAWTLEEPRRPIVCISLAASGAILSVLCFIISVRQIVSRK
jgi:amino acid permease